MCDVPSSLPPNLLEKSDKILGNQEIQNCWLDCDPGYDTSFLN